MNQAKERWLPVVGWEGVYKVSSLGRVMRIKKRKRSKFPAEHTLTPCPCSNGYAQVHLRDWPRNMPAGLVHLLVARAFMGDPPPGHEVNHKDDNRMNPRLDNLEYVTRSENQLHAYRVNMRPPVSNKGEAAGRAKLTNLQVQNIRDRYQTGKISQQTLANEFGIHQTMVGFIVRRANWTHL